MRLAFLNSSLEPGRDGVGDYTRLLSKECVRQGHNCCRVALNDRHVTEAKTSESGGVEELRLPATLPWPQRIAQAEQVLETFAPDWVSLQFVPYAFHPKGLVHGLARRLRPLMTGRRAHIMFHELWIGEAVNSSIKHRLVGAVQKRLVLNLVKVLRPLALHTSNCTYVEILRRYGVHAERLPLFGSIPVTTQNGDEWIFAELRHTGLKITPDNRHEFWFAGFFGALHPTWPPEPLLTQLTQAAKEQNRRVVLLSIGRMGEAGEKLWNALSVQYEGPLTFCRFGAQPDAQISQYLNSLDFGITSTPASLIGKSSTVAAMIDHGLPIIINRDDIRLRGTSLHDNDALLHYTSEETDPLVDMLCRQPSQSKLPFITHQFLDYLAARPQLKCH